MHFLHVTYINVVWYCAKVDKHVIWDCLQVFVCSFQRRTNISKRQTMEQSCPDCRPEVGGGVNSVNSQRNIIYFIWKQKTWIMLPLGRNILILPTFLKIKLIILSLIVTDSTNLNFDNQLIYILAKQPSHKVFFLQMIHIYFKHFWSVPNEESTWAKCPDQTLASLFQTSPHRGFWTPQLRHEPEEKCVNIYLERMLIRFNIVENIPCYAHRQLWGGSWGCPPLQISCVIIIRLEIGPKRETQGGGYLLLPFLVTWK